MEDTLRRTDVLQCPRERDVKVRFGRALDRRRRREFLREQLLRYQRRSRRQARRHGAPAYLGTISVAVGHLAHVFADGTVLPVIAGGSTDTVEVAKPSLLTVPEAAADLRVAKSTVWAMLASGELESIIVGQKSRRIPRECIAAYIAARRAEAKA